MANKKLLSLLILIGTINIAIAQKKQNTYFYKNNNTEVFDVDSADFIRIIQEPDSGSLFFNLIEGYTDGTMKTLGRVSSFHPTLKYEGQLITYHKNGKKKSVENYDKNVLIGPIYHYFESGLLRKTIELKAESPEKNKSLLRLADSLVTYQADSTGRIMVENGNGHIIDKISSYNGAILEGDYKDGRRHGFWVMKSNDGTCSYKEEYSTGKFVSGESEMNGIKSKYTSIEENPSMKGGIEKFYIYLSRSVKYPEDAMQNNIKGKVFVTFDVELDGTLANIKIIGKLYPSLDAEALRVIKNSPKWIPAKEHGFPIRQKMNIPISFSISGTPSQIFPDNGANNQRGL